MTNNRDNSISRFMVFEFGSSFNLCVCSEQLRKIYARATTFALPHSIAFDAEVDMRMMLRRPLENDPETSSSLTLGTVFLGTRYN